MVDQVPFARQRLAVNRFTVGRPNSLNAPFYDGADEGAVIARAAWSPFNPLAVH